VNFIKERKNEIEERVIQAQGHYKIKFSKGQIYLESTIHIAQYTDVNPLGILNQWVL
jgi:hypothetical protein